MIQGEAWIAITQRLAQWSETPMSLPDELFTPKGNEYFLIVQPVGLNFDTQVIGYNCGEEYRGILNISVMSPLGRSFASHIGMADRVCELFAAGSRETYGAAAVTFYERGKVIGSPRLDAAHNRLEVQIPWRNWG